MAYDKPFEQRPNTGSLWINEYKSTDMQPDLRGTISVDRDLLANLIKKDTKNVEISVSAWNKETPSGKIFLSLAISEPQNKAQNAPAQQTNKQPWEK